MKTFLLLVAFIVLVRADQKSIVVPKCPATPAFPTAPQSGLLRLTPFVNDSGNALAKYRTAASVCHDGVSLRIFYRVSDPAVYNPLSGCNTALYDYDAVETFLAIDDESGKVSKKYLEVEILDFSGQLQDCNATGIKHKASIIRGGYQAALEIPFSNIYRASGVEPSNKLPKLLGNFFRIEVDKKGPIEYSCWSSTFAEPACFHKPAYFRKIRLQQ
ncbi:hypothetical protein PROFUN_08576 [Planoprotostelium fungivorum]|uniref:Carbohydrate-binding domain-containing protein n=1 Tax=Planoprotostelium fungivorum TaxID=1890364 RepID=A0A2P6N1R0_9EUKA|nr:hypothetical protein PROFUN_08576 [Planoprotostelium fungivorum]